MIPIPLLLLDASAAVLHGTDAPDTRRYAREILRRADARPVAEHGRRGGKKGGKARAAAMTPKLRSASARKAARARWGRRKERGGALRRKRDSMANDQRQ